MNLYIKRDLENYFIHSKCSMNFGYYYYFKNEEMMIRKVNYLPKDHTARDNLSSE